MPIPKHIVLYAEDDEDDIALVQEAFNRYAGIELLVFPDGIELLNYIHYQSMSVKPCLIIIDINMPRLNGKQALKELRNIEGYEDVPAILFSTSTLKSEEEFAASFGAAFITKPLHFHQFHYLADTLIEYCTDEVKRRIKQCSK